MKWLQLPITLIAALGTALLPAAAEAQAAPPTKNADTTTSISTALFPPPGTIRIIEETKDVQPLLQQHGADLLVVNFWATYCAPCVKEIPYFMDVARQTPTDRVRVLGLTVDLKGQLHSQVIPFLNRRKVNYSNVLLFVDAEEMIEYFSDEWSGALPATFFYDKQGNKLGEVLGELTAEELNAEIKKYLTSIDSKK